MLEDQKFQVEIEDHENMDVTTDDNGSLAAPGLPPKLEVGINDLDEHIRGKIFNYLEQTEIPNVSLVCKQWKKEVDDLYEFEWTVGHIDGFGYANDEEIRFIDKNYGENTVFKPFMKKCTKCTILSMKNFPPLDDNFQFMKYPTCLKVLRIMAPLEPQYLQHIVSSSIKLEKLEFCEDSNFPSVLSLAQTPGLAQLKSLKELEIYCQAEDDDDYDNYNGQVSAFMDCHFPKLERFSLVLPPGLTIHPARLWEFLKAHASTLLNIFLSDSNWDITNTELEDFRTSNVPNFVEMYIVTKWSPIWERILYKQSNLQELVFSTEDDTFDFGSDLDDVENDVSGLPWVYFEAPIINSSNTLKSVDLCDLNMKIGNRIRPLNLSIFKSCLQLSKLALRGIKDTENSAEEMSLMINGNDLPSSLREFIISSIPMLTSDLMLIMKKLKNSMTLNTLKLFGVGSTGNLGVTSSVLIAIRGLEDLQELHITAFNTSDPEERKKLRIQIESLGERLRFNGFKTELYFSENAHVKLALLQEEEG